MVRAIIYGMMALIATVLLADTNLGAPLSADGDAEVRAAIAHISESGLTDDASLAGDIARASRFRTSLFYTILVNWCYSRGYDFSFYAYTPIVSDSTVFLGDSFWDIGNVGRSSVIVHELAHVRRHGERMLRGLPRRLDEADAYRRQYDTHKQLGLSTHEDGVVYWDMMIGVQDYVLPVYPEYKSHEDIRSALRMLKEGG